MSRFVRCAIAVAALAAGLGGAPTAALSADSAYNILPPGQYGGLPANGDSTDQLPLYDALTPLRGNVTGADIRRLYKPANFAPIGETRVENTGRPGLRFVRDRFGVPHIYGRTRADTWFGAGFAAGQDRSLLLQLGRNPARAAVADIPNVDAFSLVTSGVPYVPSAQAEALVTAQQGELVRAYGEKGRQMLRDFDDYAAGVTAGLRRAGLVTTPWNRNDVIAVTAFIGSIFGNGGGTETRNADFLARLRERLGTPRALGAFRDLMEADDPEAPTTTRRRFPYGRVAGGGPTQASPLIDAGSRQQTRVGLLPSGLPLTLPTVASNFLAVAPSRSANGNPLAVMGPQLGYFYPEIVFEADLHGPGIQAQGAFIPGGGPYMLLGRTRNYAWSLTTAQNDNVDEFVEQLCSPSGGAVTRDSDHYLRNGRCVRMRTFDAGLLNGQPATFRITDHGPVTGTVTIGGRPFAVARARTTYGRDALGQGALRDMTLGAATSPTAFRNAANQFGFTFNWAYVSRSHAAYFSSGRLPRRAPAVNNLLPTLGTGAYDWRGFIGRDEHPHDANPPDGLVLNWNNKAAPGWLHGDDVHSYGSVHRVEMFDEFARKMTLPGLVGVMNRAATEDLRATKVWPVIRAVLAGGAAPDARTGRAAELVTAWSNRGGSRLDRELDGRIDDPGAAIMDRAWERIAGAVMTPVLGSLTGELEGLVGRDQAPYDANGSAFFDGWWGYVDKDLRALLGRPVRGRFRLRYCGGGSLAACRASLWAALRAAADELAGRQGADPAAWRSDATEERITFTPGLIRDTMRWTNRPTFQQVLEFQRLGSGGGGSGGGGSGGGGSGGGGSGGGSGGGGSFTGSD